MARAKAKVKVSPKKVRCAAKTKKGEQCKNYAVGRSKYCAIHQRKKK